MPHHRQNAPQPTTNKPTSIQIHETQLHVHQLTGLARALCTCGWVKFGTLAECQAAAASHDIGDWKPVKADETPPFWTEAQP